jgi:hypothetical protein
MENPETLATPGTHDTTRRHTKHKHTSQHKQLIVCYLSVVKFICKTIYILQTNKLKCLK